MRKNLMVLFSVVLLFCVIGLFNVNVVYSKSSAKTVVSSNEELTEVINSGFYKSVILSTDTTDKFVIPSGDYSNIALYIDAPNASVLNNGVFKKIVVDSACQFSEFAKGNSIVFRTLNATINIEEQALTKMIMSKAKGSTITISLKGEVENIAIDKSSLVNVYFLNSGKLDDFVLNSTSIVNLYGTNEDNNMVCPVHLIVKKKAKKTKITTGIPVCLETFAKASVTYEIGAEESTFISENWKEYVDIINHTDVTIPAKSVYDLSERFWSPFKGVLSEGQLNSDGVSYLDMQENGKDYVNYYIQAENVVNYLYQYHYVEKNKTYLDKASQIMDSFIQTFNEYGNFPRPEYKAQNYKYGWVSSMDAPVIMLASQMLYEETKNKKYKQFINEIVPYCLKDVSEGGFNLKLSAGGIWPLEYARKSSTEQNSMFVLNGSMVGFVSVLGINTVLENKQLGEYIDSVIKAYKNMNFHYANDEWTYYMLNSKTVIPIHYLIFEEKLFDAADYLTDDLYFKKEYYFRQGLLKKVLGIEFIIENGDTASYYLHRACTPHCYQIDCYPTKVEFMNYAKEVVCTAECDVSGACDGYSDRFYEGMFLHGQIDTSECKYYRVLSNNGAGWYCLFEESIFAHKPNIETINAYSVKYIFDAFDDQNGDVVLDPQRDAKKVEGDICYYFATPISLENNIICVELDNKSNISMTTRIEIFDRKGYASRYWTNLLPGKNVIAFSPEGFADLCNIKCIDNCRIRLYEGDTLVHVSLGNVRIFSDNYNLYNYLSNSEYKIHPQ